MQNSFEMIQNLLRIKAEYQARLNLIPYEGSIDIKNNSGKNICIYANAKQVRSNPPTSVFTPKISIKRFFAELRKPENSKSKSVLSKRSLHLWDIAMKSLRPTRS